MPWFTRCGTTPVSLRHRQSAGCNWQVRPSVRRQATDRYLCGAWYGASGWKVREALPDGYDPGSRWQVRQGSPVALTVSQPIKALPAVLRKSMSALDGNAERVAV